MQHSEFFERRNGGRENLFILNIINWLFGSLVLAIGLINLFWGNDPEYGVFITLLSLVYFLPVNDICKKMTGFSMPQMGIVKILLGFFILWTALGVAELFEKLQLMKQDF